MDSDHEELAELDTSFKLKPRSKFHRLSIPQTEADAALSASSRSGIVVFPCGAGKTALFVRAAMRNYNVLVLSYESQGVLQVADVVLEETDVGKDLLCCYTAEKRTEPNRLSCFMVATYSMFAGSAHKQSNHTRAVSEFVFYQTQWDLVVCDECQHAPADTFREVIEKLRPNAKRILGFTGTLCRSQLGPGVEERIRRGELTRDEATERHFDFIGPVLFRRSCADLEATGDIAKLHLRRIETPAISHEAYFCRAHALTEGVTRLYLAAMHPCKLRALWNILHMHQSRGDQGMIFVDHLVHAAVLKNMLGKRCEVLAGADMEDMARSTSAIGNRELVKKFNAGELDVIIASPVGESSLDTYSERFRFIIVFDAHGGAAAASQRLGRAARTSRVQHDVVDVEQSQLIERQRQLQKVGFYYELVSPLTEEYTAADKRREQFEAEGYQIPTIKHADFESTMRECASEAQPFPYADVDSQIRLLHRVLTHQDRQAAETAGRKAAKGVRDGHRDAINAVKKREQGCPSPLFKERHAKQRKRLKEGRKAVQAKASEERAKAIVEHQTPEEARRVFDLLLLSKERLATLGLVY